MASDLQVATAEGLASVHGCDFLSKEDYNFLADVQPELQNNYEKRQIWRTETEMRVSVLNDTKFPDRGSKYWQAVREMGVFTENLFALSYEYRRTLVKIQRIKQKLEIAEGLDAVDLEIDLDELMFAKRNQEIQAKDRVRELRLWSKIKNELDDGSFSTDDVNKNQLLSLTKRFIAQYEAAGESATKGERINMIGPLRSAIVACKEQGVLDKVLPKEKIPAVFEHLEID